MKISAPRTILISALLLACSASRLRASNDPPTPAAPPVPPAPQAAPAPPAPPAPPAAPMTRQKRIVVTEPEKEIVVDGDRVWVWNEGDGPEEFADVEGMEIQDGHPTFMRHHGRTAGGFIGVRPIEMTPELREHFGAPRDAGILVGSVEPDGPAAKAGVRVGDIVTSVDGERIDSVGELVRTVRHKKDGEKLTVEVLRERAAKSLTIVVVERKDREIRVGALENHSGGPHWKTRGPGYAFFGTPEPGLNGLEERLEVLEKRLQELEGRLPAR